MGRRARASGSRRNRGRGAGATKARGAKAKANTVPSPSQGPWSRLTGRQSLPYVALILLVVVSYLPATQAEFVWDDVIITEADPVQTASGIKDIWLTPSAIPGEAHYWPVLYSTFWLEHQVWGFSPMGHHIVNILLYVVNVILLWHLVRRLALPGAWFVAAVFAVHPLHVESVAWIIERKDLLSGMFYFLAWLFYIRFLDNPRAGRYVGSLVLFAAGLLSKSAVITLPAALLVWHWLKEGRVRMADALRVAPFFIVGFGIVLADLAFYRSREILDLDYSFLDRVLIASRALWFYAQKLLWPTDLAVIYQRWEIDVADPVGWMYVVAVAALAAALYLLRHRTGRGPLAATIFFFVTLSPVLGFVDYGYMQFSFVADRYQYLAGIGVIALVVGLCAHVVQARNVPRVAVTGGATALLIALGTLTFRQTRVWHDDVTLNRHIVASNPRARGAHANLAASLAEASESVAAKGASVGEGGWSEEAERYLRIAIGLDSTNANAHLNYGMVLREKGLLEEALVATELALRYEPESAKAAANRGSILIALGRFDQAEDHLRQSLELNADDVSILQNLGEALRMQERHEEAAVVFEDIVAIEPENALAQGALGVTYSHLGRDEEAVAVLEQAISLAPDSPQNPLLHVLAGQSAQRSGDTAAARRHYRRALELDPNQADARALLDALR